MRSLHVTLLSTLIVAFIVASGRAERPSNEGTAAVKPATPDVPKAKLPIPSEDSQKESVTLIRDIYKADCEKAKSPEQKLELANKLVQLGVQTEGDASGKFVLIRIARDLAIQSGDLSLTLQSIDTMAKSFQIDSAAMKLQALTQIEKSASTPAGHKELAASIGPLIDESVTADNYSAAKQFAELAISAGRNSNDSAVLKTAVVRRKEIEQIAASYAEVEKAVTKLMTTPLDPAANLVVGKFRCFNKGNWEGGLPLLALGDDAVLKGLAEKELVPPTTAIARMTLGDGWWAVSESEAGAVKSRIQSRAAHWYKQALPELVGLPKAKAEKRLTEIAASGPATTISGEDDASRGKLDDAIENGLRWLASQQKDDGSWDLHGGSNPSRVNAPTTSTALALLPFLRAGETPLKGVHGKTVAKGLAYIQDRMKANEHGCQSPDKDGNMYGHAIVTMALCEAFSRTKDQKLRPTAQGAVNFIIYAQNPKTGGWRYKPKDIGDTSVLGWQLQALMAASQAQLKFPQQSFALADKFLDSTQKDGGSAYAYQPSKESAPAMSAVGLLCRTWTRGKKQPPGFAKGLEIIAANGPSSNSDSDIYYDYYATSLMNAGGGAKWKTWSEAVRSKLASSQEAQGHDSGSWFFNDHWSDDLGRLGITSFSLLILNHCKHQ